MHYNYKLLFIFLVDRITVMCVYAVKLQVYSANFRSVYFINRHSKTSIQIRWLYLERYKSIYL